MEIVRDDNVPIAGIMFAFWHYGFLGVLWSRSIVWSMAFILTLGFGPGWAANHRNDSDLRMFYYHTVVITSAYMGCLCASAAINFSILRKFPWVFDFSTLNRKGNIQWMSITFVSSILLLTSGIFLLREQQNAEKFFVHAIILTCIGVSVFIWSIILHCLSNTGIVRLKYLPLFASFVILSVVHSNMNDMLIFIYGSITIFYLVISWLYVLIVTTKQMHSSGGITFIHLFTVWLTQSVMFVTRIIINMGYSDNPIITLVYILFLSMTMIYAFIFI